MEWKNVRLELARTHEFPRGSATRGYLLRLPLEEDGLINEAMLEATPSRATVHRFWPNEPDLHGYVIRTPRGWAFSYEPGENDDEAIFLLESHQVREGEYLTLTEPDGRRLPFLVASVKPLP